MMEPRPDEPAPSLYGVLGGETAYASWAGGRRDMPAAKTEPWTVTDFELSPFMREVVGCGHHVSSGKWVRVVSSGDVY